MGLSIVGLALLGFSFGASTLALFAKAGGGIFTNPGLLEGKAKPNYAKCVDLAAKGALKELAFPCLLAILVPSVLLLVLGKEALAGFLVGSIATGIIFALFMANSGGTWDNAKKHIEAGAYGGKGSRGGERQCM